MSAAAIGPILEGTAALGAAIPGIVETFIGKPTDVGGTQRMQLRPEDIAALQRALGGLQQGQGSFLQQLQGLSSQVRPQQFMPQFSNTPDAIAQGNIAQGQQALRQQAGAQQQAIQRQFGATSPGIAQALSRQTSLQAGLQANPLLFQALQEQQGRQLGQQQLGLQATQAGNQAMLAGLGLQGQLAGQGFQAQQALPALLAQIAQMQGTQVQTRDIQRRGGLFGG